jgi:hypothetical protein
MGCLTGERGSGRRGHGLTDPSPLTLNEFWSRGLHDATGFRRSFHKLVVDGPIQLFPELFFILFNDN